MADWRKVLDDLKAEAKRKQTAELPPLRGRKWQEGDRYFYSAPREDVDKLDEVQALRFVKGWALIMSVGQIEDVPFWHFSASLYPRGRNSTNKDWKWLGSITEYLGAPDEKPRTMTASPNAPHHWMWPIKEQN